MPEFQDEVVVADFAMGLEALAHLGQVDRAMAFVNLDGISAAKRYVGSTLASEVREFMPAAGATVGAGLGSVDFGTVVGPDIER
jgi:hypothetical protein